MLRLYEAGEGVVRVLGDDVLGLDRHELRRRFAVVPQDVVLFPGTIAENVAAGGEPDRKRVESVLERIGALDLLTARPGGLDAQVGERGANFSAGERQLIAFARALYRERNGRDIETIEDLVSGPGAVLDALPPEPNGGRWIVEEWTKEIVSDLIGHRYEPKIDAVNREKLKKIREGEGA